MNIYLFYAITYFHIVIKLYKKFEYFIDTLLFVFISNLLFLLVFTFWNTINLIWYNIGKIPITIYTMITITYDMIR